MDYINESSFKGSDMHLHKNFLFKSLFEKTYLNKYWGIFERIPDELNSV